MINQTESGLDHREQQSCEISYKYADSEQSYSGECLNISGAGILFRGGHMLESGMALEISISAKNALTKPLRAYVEVIRSKQVDSEHYEVATEIKGIREY